MESVHARVRRRAVGNVPRGNVLAAYLGYHNSIEVPHGCSCERCQVGRAVFASVVDTPSVRVGDRETPP